MKRVAHCNLRYDFLFGFHSSDSSQYAQFIFNTFDTDRDGKVSFEVRFSGARFC